METGFLKTSSGSRTALDKSIETRLIEDLQYHAKGIIVGTLILYVVNLTYYATLLPDLVLILSSVLLLGSCLIRGASAWRYGRAKNHKRKVAPSAYHTEIVAAYAVMAAGWGTLGVASVLLLSASDSIVAILTVSGITGSAAATTSASPVAFKSVAFVALAPLAVALLFAGGGPLPYVGVMTTCYLLVLDRAASRSHETLLQGVSLGFENKELVQKLEHQSSVDSLTGLSNRRALNDKFEEAWSNAVGEQRPIGLILCDIDFFKEYNDCYGHLEGDRCLQKVALALRAATRSSDFTTARYGGEEFAVLLPNCRAEQLASISGRLRLAVEELAIPHGGSRIAPILTLSVGACCLVPVASMDVDDLIKAADTALYRSKKDGRNCVSLQTAPVAANG